MKRITFLLSLAIAWSVSIAAQMPITEQYRLTAKLIDELAFNLARSPTESMEEAWKANEVLLLHLLRMPFAVRVTDEERGDRNWIIERVQSKQDAWDRPIRIVLNTAGHTALLASVGPDGIEATPDDLICRLTGQIKLDDDKKSRIHYTRAWTIPEDFSKLGYQFLGDDGGTVTTTKVIVK
jgi:hypothetical protein